jgi:hypothetical protein
MIEILINGDSTQIIDHGELTNPTTGMDNYGPITLSGQPSNYLITIFDRFNKATVFTMCSYKQVVSDISTRYCKSLADDKFSLSPFSVETYDCDSDVP